MLEREIKILEIQPEAIIESLKRIGAELKSDKQLTAIEYNPTVEAGKNDVKVVRLRTDGNKTVFTVKLKKIESDTGIKAKLVEEIEVGITDYQEMQKIMSLLGFEINHERVKTRSTYTYKGMEIVIDIHLGEFAFIPPLLEIEFTDENELLSLVDELGYSKEDCKDYNFGDLVKMYKKD